MEALMRTRRVLIRRINALSQETGGHPETQLQSLQEIFHELKQTCISIINQCETEEEEEEHAQVLVECERLYHEITKNIHALLRESNSSTPVSQNSVNSAPVQPYGLPPIELPKFDGKSESWPQFAALFIEILAPYTSITPAHKLSLLTRHISAEVKCHVEHIPPSPTAFDDAWSVLEKRYSNKRVIATKLVRTIMSSKILSNTEQELKYADEANAALRGLEALKINIADAIFSVLVPDMMTPSTRSAWQEKLSSTEIPKFQDLLDFVTQRSTNLVECTSPSTSTHQLQKAPRPSVTPSECPECKLSHFLHQCPVYAKADLDDKWNIVKKHKLCTNCIRGMHRPLACSSGVCRQCYKKHHTSLHRASIAEQINKKPSSNLLIQEEEEVLLATLTVNVLDYMGKPHKLRALLDEGSQVSLITERALKTLNLPSQKVHSPLITACGTSESASHRTQATIQTSNNSVSFPVQLYSMPKVASILPTTTVPSNIKKLLSDKTLADENFDKPGPIDLLLGISVAVKLTTGNIELHDGFKAEETCFGWILRGTYPTSASQKLPKVSAFTSLHQFWDLEDLPKKTFYTPEEEATDKFITNTTQITPDGRFMMRIPLKKDPPNLGESRKQAVSRFLALERKFKKDPNFEKEYCDVMKEYFTLGHIEKVSPTSHPRMTYLPHHGVRKSPTSKLRIVFDASAKTSNNVSLNECQADCPKLQQNIFPLLTRFRAHPIAITADIQKMYRCIWIAPEDRDLQRIIWRDEKTGDLQDFRLTTVTFGEKDAPYLAIKAIHMLAETSSPLVAQSLLKDLYIDDLLSGSQTIEKTCELQKSIDKKLESAGFFTHKWLCSKPEVIQHLPPHKKASQASQQLLPNPAEHTALGILWDPENDVFKINVNKITKPKNWSRRSILSTANSLYDPLGWLSPITVTAKLIIQTIVKTTTNWDEPLSHTLTSMWQKWVEDLPKISVISVPRHLPSALSGSLCGFCDASEKAYGAVVYLREYSGKTTLVAAKTKVAPLKAITLPRLELLAAQLLAKLMKEISSELQLTIVHAYTDSTIALAWIKQHPSKWQTFVANRVSEIQDSIPPCSWQHCTSEDNPADPASRGISAEELTMSQIWWHGPPWLSRTTDSASRPNMENILPEARHHRPYSDESGLHSNVEKTVVKNLHQVVATLVLPPPKEFSVLLRSCSHYDKLRRIVARIFMLFARVKTRHIPVSFYKKADNTILQWVQHESFSEELADIRIGRDVSLKSPLACLNPKLDENGVLRVSGRLRKSNLKPQTKHPIILPARHYVTKLLIEREHISNMHAGPTHLNHILLQRYWIIFAPTVIKKTLRQCVICTKIKGQTAKQMMGDLPSSRVTPVSRPFTKVGIDYAGPIELKTHLARSTRTYKSYVAVFICMTTRAIHLELVTALTTEAFLAGFSRFTCRRGVPSHIYSDRGTNFIGADRMLAEIATHEVVQNEAASKGITWHFNPPSAPHMGGLWEAGVKSLKTHLKSVIGNHRLTYEEFYTVLCKAEATLNSRPLIPMSNDPENLDALTPAHFLTGGNLLSLPEEELTTEPLNRLSRWQLVQRLSQSLWQRWSSEYITRLQRRPKWWRQYPDLKPGTMVLVKDENQPPLKWKLARIKEVHPGEDKKTRVATIKTAHSEMMRPIHKLCPLPLDGEDSVDTQDKSTSTLKVQGLQGGQDVRALPSQ